MNSTRHQTTFALRYAVRVLERYSAFWRVASLVFKFASVLSGAGALVAMTGTITRYAVALGVVFASLQALDLVLDPSSRHAMAMANRRDYAAILAKQAILDDASLEAAHQDIVQRDEIIMPSSFKKLAFNDVMDEMGLDPSQKYDETSWVLRFLD